MPKPSPTPARRVPTKVATKGRAEHAVPLELTWLWTEFYCKLSDVLPSSTAARRLLANDGTWSDTVHEHVTPKSVVIAALHRLAWLAD